MMTTKYQQIPLFEGVDFRKKELHEQLDDLVQIEELGKYIAQKRRLRVLEFGDEDAVSLNSLSRTFTPEKIKNLVSYITSQLKEEKYDPQISGDDTDREYVLTKALSILEIEFGIDVLALSQT